MSEPRRWAQTDEEFSALIANYNKEKPRQHGRSTLSPSRKGERYKGVTVTPQPDPSPVLESKAASTYAMRAIRWFWPGRFALGKLGLIGGLPDKGKGLISADIISRCTRGSEWPCG